MKKKYFMVAAAALILASCSNDAVVDLKQNEITFSVATENSSRAANVYCANNMMDNFSLWATVPTEEGVKDYIKGDVYAPAATGNTWVTTNTRYWPEGNVNFYAAVNGKINDTPIGANPTLDFTVDTDVKKQTDLLYAANVEEHRDPSFNPEPVKLNFRHALSQVMFKARNENTTLYVEVTGVRVGHGYVGGTLTFPSDDTFDNIPGHDQTGTADGVNRGTWAFNKLEGDSIQRYDVNWDTPITVTAEGVSLTATNDDGKEYSSNALMLMPTVNPVNPVSPEADADGEGTLPAWDPTLNVGYNGTYIAVKCKIYNIADTTFDPATDVELQDGYCVIPVKFNWEQGKKYTYTFVFGKEGNGGYEDDPKKPTPVLIPMSFEVTVDEFQTGDENPDEDMNATDQGV